MRYTENKLINNIIENEFYHVQNESLDIMDELEEYNKIVDETNNLKDKLFKLLPVEYHDLLDDWDCKTWELATLECRHYFKKGVCAGTSNLNFVRGITGGMKFY